MEYHDATDDFSIFFDGHSITRDISIFTDLQDFIKDCIATDSDNEWDFGFFEWLFSDWVFELVDFRPLAGVYLYWSAADDLCCVFQITNGSSGFVLATMIPECAQEMIVLSNTEISSPVFMWCIAFFAGHDIPDSISGLIEELCRL